MKDKNEVTALEAILTLGTVFVVGVGAIGLVLASCVKYLFWS